MTKRGLGTEVILCLSVMPARSVLWCEGVLRVGFSEKSGHGGYLHCIKAAWSLER